MTATLLPGNEGNSSELYLVRMLQILREFSTDPILSVYVIDDVWEYMKSMKVCYTFLTRRNTKGKSKRV